MGKPALTKTSLSPTGDVLKVEGSLTFQNWSEVLPFSGQSIDLTQTSKIDSAGLGMLLCCVQRGVRITGCHTLIREPVKNSGLCGHCPPEAHCVN